MAAHVAGCFENIFDNEIVEPFSFTLELHALTLQLLAPRLLHLTRFPFLAPTGWSLIEGLADDGKRITALDVVSSRASRREDIGRGSRGRDRVGIGG